MCDFKVGCLLMAAGNATRFGENKLLQTVNGRKLVALALQVAKEPLFYRRVVVTQLGPVQDVCSMWNWVIELNDQPEKGLSHTIKLGMAALSDADAILFLVADQPYLKAESIENMLMLSRNHPDNIIVLASKERRGNPCLFPKRFFAELLALQGDHGGRSVIEAHEKDVLYCEALEDKELADIDVKSDLK